MSGCNLDVPNGNSAVKIDGGRGQRPLSLHCNEKEFPSNFDVVPKVFSVILLGHVQDFVRCVSFYVHPPAKYY